MFRRKRRTADAPAPHPVIVPAQVLSEIAPAIPPNFLGAHLPRDGHRDQSEIAFWALFTVHADGTATVAMTESTGHAALDALALDAARRWRFAPATQDGVPVESYLRLKVEFEGTPPGGPRPGREKHRR